MNGQHPIGVRGGLSTLCALVLVLGIAACESALDPLASADAGAAVEDQDGEASALTFVTGSPDWIEDPGLDAVTAATVVDVNGDGRDDVVVVGSGGLRTLLSDGTGAFALGDVGSVAADYTLVAVATADWSGDGADDIATCGIDGAPLMLWISGASEPMVVSDESPRDCAALAAWDVDGDGRDELVELLTDGTLRAWRIALPSGGELLATAEVSSGQADRTLAVADLDGDGRAALLVTGDGELLFVETGGLDDADTPDETGLATIDLRIARYMGDPGAGRVVVSLDADGDGDDDIFIGGRDGVHRLLVNDGNGRFRDATWEGLPVSEVTARSASRGDINRDGVDDLLVAVEDGFDRLYVGHPDGRFADRTAALNFATSDAWAVLFIDADSDGDIDVVSVPETGRPRLHAQVETTVEDQ